MSSHLCISTYKSPRHDVLKLEVCICISTYKSPRHDVLKLELCFVGRDCSMVPAVLGTTYGCQARRLDLSFNKINSLCGLERFPYLEELILDNNCLGDDALWPFMPYLTSLSINKNYFSNTAQLLCQLQKACPKLRYLSMLNNSACPDIFNAATETSNYDQFEETYQQYRLLVLQHLPKLRFLNGQPASKKKPRSAKDGSSPFTEPTSK
ncbi:leucine-rich melanocyte differentiation-associated protein [Hyalella azteca]|uniref:Leucine-rich melanocyte differentiation-associated protein n=1 Tax=Hyalella azteca TaxID=294128 RepID=A0A8B7NHS9_HYAAZ|nr:leucine-rich melanocyte differentiation-associated protein [Hyalella azteca]